MASVEEKVEDYYKKILENYGFKIYGKNIAPTPDIETQLKNAHSKSGGTGNNYPDIMVSLENSYRRTIYVMIEAKGNKGKLVKYDSDGFIQQAVKKNGKLSYTAIQNYAVNGALHYGLACLNSESINEIIVIGINGSELDDNNKLKNPEFLAWYVSKKNNKVPKKIELDDDWIQFKKNNLNSFFEYLDTLNLTEEEIKANEEKAEAELEEKIHAIHQKLYEDACLKTPLTTNEKLYLFCGLIMAGLKNEGVSPLTLDDFHSNNNEEENDGETIIRRIRAFLKNKKSSPEKIEMIIRLLGNVFQKKILWEPHNGVSLLKELYGQIKEDIIPLLESNWHLDFTGKILNRLSDWISIENDIKNDVVLTPSYITNFMARLTRTNMNSFVWDKAMGSGGFLVAALKIMQEDAQKKIKDKEELERKIEHIKREQILGVEILENIYILGVLNMILMGDGSAKIINNDSHKDLDEYKNFPATVFLLNPPYSASGKGMNFVEETLKQMTKGYAAILIQENAGSGMGLPYTKNILKNNTLIASISMPADLFSGKASVKTCIYLFKVASPHEKDDEVIFIDMSNDGYARQNRKKSSMKVNLRDVDDAKGRYDEVVAKLTGKKAKTNYYTEENGLLIRDTISLEGNDWTFAQHKRVSLEVTEKDFKKVVSEYLSFRVSQILKGEK